MGVNRTGPPGVSVLSGTQKGVNESASLFGRQGASDSRRASFEARQLQHPCGKMRLRSSSPPADSGLTLYILRQSM
jgi:hypothetical protein